MKCVRRLELGQLTVFARIPGSDTGAEVRGAEGCLLPEAGAGGFPQ